MADIKYRSFKEINFKDPFFDGLKDDYPYFETWYQKKSIKDEKAYVYYSDKKELVCFLYLKEEYPVDNTNISPPLYNKKWLKIETFKVIPHHTRLGERLVKKICDFAIDKNILYLYTTIFPKHSGLVNLLKRYGFFEYGRKVQEIVLVKIIPTRLDEMRENILYDFPAMRLDRTKKFLLAIYPEFHTRMFADSKLKTEQNDILQDCSESNSIHKIYITSMNGVEKLKSGDILIIYRTRDGKAKNANYSAVVTSLCIVEEYKDIKDFLNQDDFLQYCSQHSIFTKNELIKIYHEKKYRKIIKMTYNISFKKRIILDALRRILINEPSYWGFFELSDTHFREILKEVEVNDRIIID